MAIRTKTGKTRIFITARTTSVEQIEREWEEKGLSNHKVHKHNYLNIVFHENNLASFLQKQIGIA